MYYINRNNQDFGPFSEKAIIDGYKRGMVLKKDRIKKDGFHNYLSVEEYLHQYAINVKGPSERNVFSLFKNLGKVTSNFLFPFKDLRRGWFENKTLIFLLFLVFFPALGVAYTNSILVIYWLLAFYFSIIWGVIFYNMFSTPQVKYKMAVGVYLFTAIFSAIFVPLANLLPPVSYLLELAYSQYFLSNLAGMFLGVGFIEELSKAFVIFLIIKYTKEIISPQTAIFYGLISGLGFGIFEGVYYQIGLNHELELDMAYFMNLIRLTSLPFFHAIWAGISAFFIAMSFITPKMKYSLRIFGILLPALIHGLYNTLGWSIAGFGIVLLSTILLMVYLTKSKSLHATIIKNNK